MSSSLFPFKHSSFPNLSNRYLTKEIECELLYIHEILKGPFKNISELREATLNAAKYILKKEYLNLNDLKENPERFFSLLELFGLAGGGSLATLLGVQLLLGGGAALNLMNSVQREKFIHSIQNGEILVCFAMTEMGHGTNVPGIQTLAIFDQDQQEFIIDNVNYIFRDGEILTCDLNETRTASKMFIGNAPNSDFGIVFAQLIIKENNHLISKGPHAFLVSFKENLNKIEFIDLGEKFGLNGICNAMIRFNGVRIPHENLMMHKLVHFSQEGVYTKLVPSPLMSLYSAIKFGRTYISCTSQSFIGVMCYLAMLLKNHSSLAIRPDQQSMARWFSMAVALLFAKKSLIKNLHQQSDAVATGMKVFSTTLAEKVFTELSVFIPPQGFMDRQLRKVYQDWVASCTYEGDNAIIPQKVVGDQLLHLQAFGKKFQIQRDIPFLFEIFNALKGIMHINLGDSLFNEMREQCWICILTLSMKLNLIMQAPVDDKIKNMTFSTIWMENQFLINSLANLYTSLFVLKEFKSQVNNEQMNNLYIIFRNDVYINFYNELFKFTDTLYSPFVINETTLDSAPYEYLRTLLKTGIPKEKLDEINMEQKKMSGKIAPYFGEVMASLTGNNSALIQCIQKKFIPETILDSENEQQSTIKFARL